MTKQSLHMSLMTSYLEFIWNVLLVQWIKTNKLKTLRHNVEGLVVSFRAHCCLIGANLKRQNI